MYKQVKIANTYACKKAINISRPVSATIKARGKKPANPNETTKPAKTLSNVWPANMLANSLTDKLIGLERYEITSIGINKGSIYQGRPGITKNEKKCRPCFTKPSIVTPINTTAARAKVTIIWLVNVKLYGIIQTIFPTRTNINIVNTNGKKRLPCSPTVSLNNWATKLYINSDTSCILEGTIDLVLTLNVKNSVITETVITIASEELVNEIS